MAFEGLSSRLQEITRKIRGKARITESDLKEMLREVKLALLEADVNYKIVKEFISSIQEKALGQDVMKSLTPGQQVINIVKEQNYKFYYACEEAEKVMLIFYPDKYMDLFENERFNYSQFVKLIRIKLPNELKGTYSHKDYLSGIMKLGIKT